MKIQWPGFDAQTVAEIEEYLGMAEDTEIVYRGIDSHNLDTRREIERTGIYKIRARGAEQKRYCRPMFEVFDDGVTSAVGRRRQVHESCPECDDWSRTAVCTVHPELSLDEIRWHRQQDRRWPDIRFGPPQEGERWAGDPETEAEPWSVSVRAHASNREFQEALNAYARELTAIRANHHAYGFEVRPGEWTIAVANPA